LCNTLLVPYWNVRYHLHEWKCYYQDLMVQ
jgi:hypothetical protein